MARFLKCEIIIKPGIFRLCYVMPAQCVCFKKSCVMAASLMWTCDSMSWVCANRCFSVSKYTNDILILKVYTKTVCFRGHRFFIFNEVMTAFVPFVTASEHACRHWYSRLVSRMSNSPSLDSQKSDITIKLGTCRLWVVCASRNPEHL